MADRTVLVKLAADVRGFVSGFQRAGAEADKFGGRVANSARQNEQAFNTLGTAFLGIGAALAAGVGVAIAASAKFEQQMSAVQVATGATGAELDSLRDAAMQAGRDTAFSAQEAAEGIEQLAKAGVSAADITGGALAGALDLAAAGGLSVADAAETTAITLKQFGLEGDRATGVADALAAGANLAVGDVSDLGQALRQSGQVASGFGVSMEETAGALAAFASQGLLGSDAGTSLKTMLQRLASPVKEVQDTMADLGIEVFDANGEFVGLAGVAGELQAGMSNLTDEQRNAAMATIFGSDAVRAANVLFKEGADGIEQWTENVSQSGFAADQAAGRLDNLAGDLQILRGSIETFFIGLGSSSQGPLREVVQDLTTLVNIASEAPDPLQRAGIGMATLGAAVGLAGGAAVLAVPKFVQLYDALGTLGTRGVKAQAGLRGLALFLANPYVAAFTVATAVVGGAFIKSQIDARQRAEELTGSLEDQTGAITDMTRETVRSQLTADGTAESARKLGINFGSVVEAALKGGPALDDLAGSFEEVKARNAEMNEADFATYFTDVVGGAQEARGAVEGASEAFRENWEESSRASFGLKVAGDRYTAMADAMINRGDLAAGALDATGEALDDVGGAAEDADSELQSLIDTFDEMAGRQLSARDAARNYEAALDDFVEVVKEARDEGLTHAEMLDTTTEAGREVEASLDAVAAAANDETAAMLDAGESLLTARGKALEARGTFVDFAMNALGYSREEAVGLSRDLIAVPDVDPSITVKGVSESVARAAAVRREINSIPASRSSTITLTTIERRLVQQGFSVLPESAMAGRRRARGGYTSPGMTLVGEEGPELVDFRTPGRVYTAQQTAAAMSAPASIGGGGGGVSRNEITVTLTGDLVDVLRTQIANRGGDPVRVLSRR